MPALATYLGIPWFSRGPRPQAGLYRFCSGGARQRSQDSGQHADATNQPGPNGGRFGFFSDIYYDPTLNQWRALSDRGPGSGVLAYDTRLTRFEINVHPIFDVPHTGTRAKIEARGAQL